MNFVKKIFSEPIIEWIFFLWFNFVYFSYIYFHGAFFEFMALFFVGFILFGYGYFILGRYNFSQYIARLKWPLWRFAVVIYAGIIFLSLIFYLSTHAVGSSSIFLYWWIFLSKIAVHITARIVFLVLLLIVSAGLGKKISKKFIEFSSNIFEELIFCFGIGFMAINYFAFLAVAIHLQYQILLAALTLAIIVYVRDDIFYFIKKIIYVEIPLEFRVSRKIEHLKAYAIVLAVLFIVLAFLGTLLAVSVDYDDLSIYYSVPLLYSHYNAIIPFNSSLSMSGGIVMFFYSYINTLLAPVFVLSTSFYFLIMVLFSLCVFVKNFFSKSLSTATFFLAMTLPIGVHFTMTQKVDFILAFYSILCIFAFFKWLHSNNKKYLVFSSSFLGYAIAVKLTGLFLLLTMCLFLLFLIVWRKGKIQDALLYIAVAVILFSPLGLLNIYYYQNPFAPLTIGNFPYIRSENVFNQEKRVNLYEIFYTRYAKERLWEYTRLTRQNHIYDSSVKNFFWKIWNITINQRGFSFMYSEVTPFFLSLLPLFVFYFFQKNFFREKNILYLTIISFTYLVVWFIFGNERSWYGIPGIYLLFILCAMALANIKNKKIFVAFLFLAILFFVRTLSFFILIISQDHNIMKSPQELSYKKVIYTADFPFYNFLNQKIIPYNERKRILMISESRSAPIYEADKNIISDQFNVFWGKILDEAHTPEEVKEILLEQDVSYIIYSTRGEGYIASFAGDSRNKYRLLRDLDTFHEFKEKFLTEVYCEDEFCIYKI